jgi:hypothetical protein
VSGTTAFTLVVALVAALFVVAAGAADIQRMLEPVPWWAFPFGLLWAVTYVYGRWVPLLTKLRDLVVLTHSEEQHAEPANLGCTRCGVLYPSRYYFATFGRNERVCDTCTATARQHAPRDAGEQPSAREVTIAPQQELPSREQRARDGAAEQCNEPDEPRGSRN